MGKLTYALGMVETIGFPAMVAAADAAAKAADVKVTTFQKADSGIVTIYIIGDVASVQSAVDVGKEAANHVGQFRHAHVIARPDEHVIQMLFPKESEKSNVYSETRANREVQDIPNDLNKKSLQELRELANSFDGFSLSPEAITKTKREELLKNIYKFQAGKGGDK
ncbi:BMC domain-containing protein [Bacillus sp. X1(2014)]|uniref:BMC domain-containing protein n=1 Tax=Bacillus sp. X1(2014) TaxID=1565991 RepID=UPI0021B45C8A|nr:BMC domain-containing protein [Bacillus sp. X1(2014)]